VPELAFDGRHRVIIEGVSPAVDGRNFPAKRFAGDTVTVEADVFADGHDVISAVLLYRHASERKAAEVRMLPLVNDRWRAEFRVEQLGFYFYALEGWIAHFLTWYRDLRKRADDVQMLIVLDMLWSASARAHAREGRVEGQGGPPNRCADRAEPRLGLMPPAGCSPLSGAPGGDGSDDLRPVFPEECAQVPSAIMLSFGAIGAALRRPSSLPASWRLIKAGNGVVTSPSAC